MNEGAFSPNLSGGRAKRSPLLTVKKDCFAEKGRGELSQFSFFYVLLNRIHYKHTNCTVFVPSTSVVFVHLESMSHIYGAPPVHATDKLAPRIYGSFYRKRRFSRLEFSNKRNLQFFIKLIYIALFISLSTLI